MTALSVIGKNLETWMFSYRIIDKSYNSHTFVEYIYMEVEFNELRLHE